MKRIRRWLLVRILGAKTIDLILDTMQTGLDMYALEIGEVPGDRVDAGLKLAGIVGGKRAEAYRSRVNDPEGIIFQRTDRIGR